MNVRPPKVKESWDECDLDTKCDILAFDQVMTLEDNEATSKMFKI